MQAYWSRATEMAELLVPEDHQRLLDHARKQRGRLMIGFRKKFKELRTALEGATGPYRFEDIDRAANRFALWSVRKFFDWPPADWNPPGRADLRALNDGICGGIWELDVIVRRKVESLLVHEGPAMEARRLRDEVDREAGSLAASLDVASHSPEIDTWDEVRRKYDQVYDELNELLAHAGSPPST